jgi:hypothetical protein
MMSLRIARRASISINGIRALWRQISNLFRIWVVHDGDLPSENRFSNITSSLPPRPVRTLAATDGESGAKKGEHHKPAYSAPIPFYIGPLPTYNWSAVSILLVSMLLGKADSR